MLMENQTPKLAIQNLFFAYADETEALRNINLTVGRNELFVLFGPARSGKTTLLRLLNRLSDLLADAKIQGTVLFNGQNIFARNMNVIELRRRISMVFAIPTPLPGSIYDNLAYGLKMSGIRDRETLDARVSRSLQQAALWDEVKDRLHSSAFALSGGQKQRLCLARSLAMEPEVILLDNPTSGLDPISTAARVADRAAFLLDGEVIEVGQQQDLFLNPKDQRTEDYVTGRFG